MATRKIPASVPQGAVTALLPVEIQPGNVRYAPGIRAGRWVFATGHKGTADFISGMAPEVIDAEAPRHSVPKYKKEARQVFANFAKVLKAGGSDRAHVVRVDQYTPAAMWSTPTTRCGASSSAAMCRRARPTCTRSSCSTGRTWKCS